jgi:hypothetical protein
MYIVVNHVLSFPLLTAFTLALTLRTLFIFLSGDMGARTYMQTVLNYARCCRYYSEARSDAERDALRVVSMLRSCAKLAKMHHWKPCYENSEQCIVGSSSANVKFANTET